MFSLSIFGVRKGDWTFVFTFSSNNLHLARTRTLRSYLIILSTIHNHNHICFCNAKQPINEVGA